MLPVKQRVQPSANLDSQNVPRGPGGGIKSGGYGEGVGVGGLEGGWAIEGPQVEEELGWRGRWQRSKSEQMKPILGGGRKGNNPASPSFV